MARKVVKKSGWLPLGPRNRFWFGVAAGVIAVGYIFLSIGPWDSFWSLSLAPVLLGLGYFVLIPYAIMTRGERPRTEERKAAGSTS